MTRFQVDNNVAALRDPDKFSYGELIVLESALQRHIKVLAEVQNGLIMAEVSVSQELLSEVKQALLDSETVFK